MPAGFVRLDMSVGGRMEGPVNSAGSSRVDSKLVYQWPGAYFEGAFRGSELFLDVGQGRQALRVSVDDLATATFVTSGPGTYQVAGLGSGSHRVRVQVLNESQAGPEGFNGFAVPEGRALPAPQPRARQMEFIGDSYTVGYGNTSMDRKCSAEQIWATTDVSKSFGALMAGSYDADFQVNAISGRGVVRNYNGFAADTLPVAYPFVLFDKKERYANPEWRPQVIVVGLGTNDFSTALHAGERWRSRDALHRQYERGFEHFLKNLRKRNVHALLIVWATDGAGGEIEAEARKVVEHMQSRGERRIEFVPVHGLAMSGCDSHPSTADDQQIAARLREAIDARPDVWDGKP